MKMALRNTPAFEAETFEDSADLDAAETGASTTTAAATASTTTAIAPATSTAVTVAPAFVNVLEELKDAIRVEYDTVPKLVAFADGFADKQNNLKLGTEITLDLHSYQEYWIATPSDTDSDVELLKYSDDGVASRDGINLQAHVADLQAQGYKNARISHHCVIVGELISATNDQTHVGELVQVDLPDTGRRAFNTYQLQASFKVHKRSLSAEDAKRVHLKAVVATKGKNTYPKVEVKSAK